MQVAGQSRQLVEALAGVKLFPKYLDMEVLVCEQAVVGGRCIL